MTSQTKLPNLSSWAAARFTTLYKATNEATFNHVFDGLFMDQAVITVNGSRFTRDQYRQYLQTTKGREGAQVTWTGAVDAPADAHRPADGGYVGLFMHATSDTGLMILGAPETFSVTASYNMMIQEVTNPGGPIQRGEPYDDRRIAALTEVSAEKSNNIRPPTQ